VPLNNRRDFSRADLGEEPIAAQGVAAQSFSPMQSGKRKQKMLKVPEPPRPSSGWYALAQQTLITHCQGARFRVNIFQQRGVIQF
jgi:hypothetical protein